MMEPSMGLDGDDVDEEDLYDEDVDTNEDELEDIHLPSADSLAALLSKG